ncbi:MAG TPA: hypothetical protein VG476_02000 [Acidimicrobiales bacterium]|nr:hypothetical protein [Acidimicrobiales bacterium]
MRPGRSPALGLAGLIVVGLGLAGLVLAGCAPGAVSALPPPPSTAPSQSTTTTPDSSGVTLQGVAGRTTIPGVAFRPGHANLSGTVGGPSGPTGGATVEIERLVGDVAGTMRVAAGPDGRWSLPGVLGGRYRVRAWRTPDQTMDSPAIFFLGGSENRTVDLTLQSFSGPAVTSAIAPNPPVVSQPASLVIDVSNRSVDSNGVGRSNPTAGASVQLTGSGAWQISGSNTATTDGGGQVTWQLTCQSSGSQPLSASVNGGLPLSINVPGCA